MTKCTVRRYEQLETSHETIEQELRPAVYEHRQTDRQTDRFKGNYSRLSNDKFGRTFSYTSLLFYTMTDVQLFVCVNSWNGGPDSGSGDCPDLSRLFHGMLWQKTKVRVYCL